MNDHLRHASCQCGKVKFEAKDDPIVTAVCYCDDCQASGEMLQALPNSSNVLEEDKGTSYLTYRDDRWVCVLGKDLLKGYKLKDKSPTTRYVATCCNSTMYLKYMRGHWVSTYRKRFVSGDLPKIDMRTNTRFRTSQIPIPQDAPSYNRFPIKLFWKLISARIDMARGK